MRRRFVNIESPFAGDRATHQLYLKRAVLDSIAREEVPFASHGFYTQFLDDNIPADRELGISLNLELMNFTMSVVFYIDYGLSPGMVEALKFAIANQKAIEFRRIGHNDSPTKSD